MKKLSIIILTFVLTVSCEKVALNNQYSFLYGDWTPTQISAGLSYSEDPHKLGDIVQFIKNDSYKVILNSITVESGKFDIESQTENELILKFNVKVLNPIDQSLISLSRPSLIVTVHSQDSIRLSNLASDGGYFELLLVRKK